MEYTTVTTNKTEYACNNITLPIAGSTLEIKDNGNLFLYGGNTVVLDDKFSMESDGKLEISTGSITKICEIDCGMEFLAANNALIYGDPTNGKIVMAARNVNSYDLVVLNQSGAVVYQGVGKVTNGVLTTL